MWPKRPERLASERLVDIPEAQDKVFIKQGIRSNQPSTGCVSSRLDHSMRSLDDKQTWNESLLCKPVLLCIHDHKLKEAGRTIIRCVFLLSQGSSATAGLLRSFHAFTSKQQSAELRIAQPWHCWQRLTGRKPDAVVRSANEGVRNASFSSLLLFILL